VPVTIGVAGGPAKVVPILGALRSGAVNTLVTDVVTAQSVVAAAEAA
jgi:DNA-binding transcriptional regulator LsrR (DeoR family)